MLVPGRRKGVGAWEATLKGHHSHEQVMGRKPSDGQEAECMGMHYLERCSSALLGELLAETLQEPPGGHAAVQGGAQTVAAGKGCHLPETEWAQAGTRPGREKQLSCKRPARMLAPVHRAADEGWLKSPPEKLPCTCTASECAQVQHMPRLLEQAHLC